MASSVTRYQPQSSLTRLPDMIDRLFQESFVAPTAIDRFFGGTSRPSLAVNMYESAEGYTLEAALPGLSPDSLDIQVAGREVQLKGKFQREVPENVTWIWRGIPSGDFFETYSLPAEVDGDKVEATYDAGIVTIKLPKAEHLRPKSIKVSVAK
jgi:HSP20 family protein